VGPAGVAVVDFVGAWRGGRRDPHRLEDLLQPGLDLLCVRPAEVDVRRRLALRPVRALVRRAVVRVLGDEVGALVGVHNWKSAARIGPGAIGCRGEPQFTLAAPLSSVGRPPFERKPMVTTEDVRDALLERIASQTVSADAQEVLALAKAYSYLVDDDDDEDDDEDDDDD
jgi:hypothetical protein